MQMDANPLLDFSGCRASPRSSPSTSRPRSTSCSPRAAHRSSGSPRRRRRRRGTRSSSRWRTRTSASARAWGQVAHLHAVMDTPGAARGLQREPAQGHPVLDRARPEPARCSRSTRRCAPRRASRRSRPRGSEDRRQRAARLPPRRRGAAAATQKARFTPRSRRSSRELVARSQENVLDATNAFALYVDRRARARRHPRGRARRPRARRREKDGRTGWKFTLHMPSLPAGDAVRRRPRAARADVPRHTSRAPPSSASPEWDNTPLIARILALRARGGARCSAIATTPRCRSCRRWRESPAEVLAFLRGPRAPRARPSPSATWRSCANSRAPSSGSRARGLGHRATPPRSCASSATPSPTRK